MTSADEDVLGALREVARDLFGGETPKAPDEGSVRFDRSLWRRACGQVGVAGVAEPAASGGAGCGFAGLAVLASEAGRALSSLPVLSSVVLGQGVLEAADDPEARERYLPGLLSGESVATLALDDGPGAPVEESHSRAHAGALGWTVTGTKYFVLDGMSADVVFLTAEAPAGPSLFAVGPGATGVMRHRADSLDLTREFAVLELRDAPARLIGAEGGAEPVIAALRRRRAAALACEQLGAAERALEMAVAYLGVRVQFGRVIGSFQALKHRCADLAISLDDARSAVSYVVWAMDHAPDEADLAASMAAAVTTSTLLHCAKENVHLHGGIGFTWEHPAHLYYRRAVSNAGLYGDVAHHREATLTALGI